MNREEYIKQLILQKGYNVKTFAASIGMPYSTLLTMLNGSIGGASIDNVIKICKGLNITISDLQEHIQNETPFSAPVQLSDHETRVIIAYRNNPPMQSAVDKLLNVSDDTDAGNIADDMARQLNIKLSEKVTTK